MDFLDPKRKKAHRRQLMVGYVLMGILIAFATIAMLYLAYGYDVNRKSGELIQNGIVFVDSQPQGATIYVNDTAERNKTNTRLVLPAGVYTVRLEAEGYRTWERTFNLEGGQIERLVYPYLVPNVLTTSDIQQYDTAPQLASQSPDRRWLLVQRPGQTYQFDVFDLNSPDQSPTQAAVPVTLLTSTSADATLEFVEWSTNNRHVLIKRSYESKTEYLIFDRENPSESVNINTLLGVNPAEVSLKDKRPDQIYFLESTSGILRSANTKARTISAPLVSSVIDYKSYGEDIVLYATQEGAETGKTNFVILEGDKTFVLKAVSQSEAYVLDVSRYEGEWYYVTGGSADNMAFVYKNPLSSLKQETRTPLTVTAIMRVDNPRFASFSANTQFIGVQSGRNLLTLDLEVGRQYRTELDHEIGLAQEIKWMDGHRYYFAVNKQSYIVDFDGSNLQTLVTTELANGPYFDRDYDNVFTFEGSKTSSGKSALTITVIED